MKRKLSLLVCLMMCFNSVFSISMHAEEYTQTALTPVQAEALDILQTLDIVSGEYDELTLDLSKEVTRAEFAIYLRKFANLPERDGTALYYNDVSRNHYAYNDITILTEYGYLGGVGDKLFAPEDVMLKEHAYAAFLKLLGYGTYMEARGVAAAAGYAGISEHVSGSTMLTTGDLFIIMYNALIADCFEIDSYGTTGPSFSKGDTQYLYKTRKMKYFSQGTVTGVHGASIYNTAHTNRRMIIDDVLIELDDQDYFNYLGLKVHYIIQFDDGSDYKLVWIGESQANDVIRLSVDEDSTFDSEQNILEYGDGDGYTKKYRIADNVTIIYNGDFYSGSTYDVLGRAKYELTLLSIEKTNDLAIVWSYDNILVRGRDSTEQTVHDELSDTDLSLDPDAYASFSLTAASGAAIAFEDIEDNDVISVFISQNENRFRGIVNREIVSGDITSIRDDAIEVDGTFYAYYDSTKTFNTEAKSAELYLDYRGYIADASYSFVNNSRFVAYAYAAYYDDVEETILLKILNENGTVERVTTENRVRFNGTKQSCDAVYGQLGKLSEERLKPQLMLLQKNQEGKITAISTSSDNGGGNELIKNQEMTGQNVWACQAASQQNIIGVSMLYDENTKVFNVPADADVLDAKDSKFSVSGVQNDIKYQDAVSYKVTTDEVFYEQYIVHKSPASITIGVTEKFVQVSELAKGLNEEEEVVDILETVSAGATKSKYPVSMDCEFSDICGSGTAISDLSPGDIVRTVVQDEELVKIELIYKHNSTGHFFYGDGGWGLNQFGLIYGECQLRIFSSTVRNKLGAAFKVETGYNGTTYPEKKDQVLNLAKDDTIIVVYDGENFYKGTYNDISIGDFVVAQTHYNDITAVAVYKQ